MYIYLNIYCVDYRSKVVRRALLGAGVRLPRARARVHAAQAPRARAPLQRAAAALAR